MTRLEQPDEKVIEHRAVQRFLVAKVVIEQRLVDPGGGGDGVHARARQAFLGEFDQRRLQDGAAAGLGLAAGAAAGRRWNAVVTSLINQLVRLAHRRARFNFLTSGSSAPGLPRANSISPKKVAGAGSVSAPEGRAESRLALAHMGDEQQNCCAVKASTPFGPCRESEAMPGLAMGHLPRSICHEPKERWR